MKKLILSAAALLIFGGCSSTQEHDGPEEQAISEVRLQETSSPAQSSPAKISELKQAITSGNPEQIKTVSTDVLMSNPKDVKALNALAVYYMGKRQYSAASLLLDKAVLVEPRNEILYNNLGMVALALNEQSRAVLMFRKSMELNSKYYRPASNVAAIYLQEKDYSKVLFTLESFVTAGEADNAGLSNYAVALVATGKDKEAGQIYEQILKGSPDHKAAMLNYSIVLIEKQQKYQEGLDLLNRLKFVGYDNGARQTINDLEVKAKAGLK